jgi:hypothetical protein
MLMACDVAFDDATNTLTIIGKEGRHNIEIVGADDELRVRCDGVDHGPFDLGKLDQVAKIVVDTTSDSSSDRVSFRFVDSVPELNNIEVKLGDGNDSLSLRFDDEVSADLSVTADLGAGNDALSHRFEEAIGVNADLKFEAKLGDGNDTASYRYREEVSGTHSITTDLGAGRNSFSYDAEGDWKGDVRLFVTGGDGNDGAAVRFREDITGSVLMGADLKNGTNLFTFRADEDWHAGGKVASTITIIGGEGADTARVQLEEDVAGLVAIVAPLGNGTNHFTLEVDEDWQNAESKIHYVGGAGADDVDLRFHGEIPPGLEVLAELGDGRNSFTFHSSDGWNALTPPAERAFLIVRGGADRDHIVARMGQVRGNLDIELDGGTGDDVIAATLRLPPPEAASPVAHDIRAKLNGGDGNDLLTLLAFGDPDAKNLTINGGAGDRDTAVATSNVVITNAERIRRVRST